eukprot:51495_1
MSSTMEKDHNLEETTNWQKKTEIIPMEQREKMENFVRDLAQNTECESSKDWTQAQLTLRKKYKIVPRKAQLKVMYEHLLLQNEISSNESLQRYLIRKGVRSLSGVLVITIFTSPYPQYIDPKTGKMKTQRFSCKHNCYYCPNEPDMPRSYLSDEPGVRRGHRHKWDAIDQFYSRATTLRDLGHPVDKIEILILGGTWSEYPIPYQEQFIRDIYWSANTFFDGCVEFKNKRKSVSLLEEQKINENTKCRIIGLTLETRPDTITVSEIERMRYYGCTRLQIGIQHTNNKILDKINRGCTNEDAIEAVRLLKNSAFKIDFHLMPDLPGSTPDLDMKMINYVLHSDEMQADQWKLYPCQTVPWTVIKQWNESGEYIPYAQEELIELLIWIKARIHPWIRLNRVIRDIPAHYISAGNPVTNLRQIILKRMKQRGLKCKCIRCREIGAFFRNANDNQVDKKEKKRRKRLKRQLKKKGGNLKQVEQMLDMRTDEQKEIDKKNEEIVLKEREYKSSGGDEIFISYERNDEAYIYGFVRLRLPVKDVMNDEYKDEFESVYKTFPELEGAALVRELHVYGQMIKVGDKKKMKELRKKKKSGHDLYAQHYGFGTKLMKRVEMVAWRNGYKRVAVIAGIGTRAYYRKLGYKLKGTYMVKELNSGYINWIVDRINKQTLLVASGVMLAVGVTYFMWYRRNECKSKNDELKKK